MGYAERHIVTLTTDADGNCTAYSPVVSGRVSKVRYVKTDFADGVDFTVTSEATGETIWAETNVNATASRPTRELVYTTTGSSIAYAATFGVYESIVVANDRIKIVVAQGGDTKTGAIHIVMEQNND